MVDEEYYQPAVEFLRELGLWTPLALVELYDANIQHGPGNDPDGLPAIIQHTTERAGGSPATGVGEVGWLFTFQDVRLETLENSFDPETRDAWAESVYRVEIMIVIADADNFDFESPIVIDAPEHHATVP